RFDRLSGRWFVAALSNQPMLAVSSGVVLTPQTTWTFFKMKQDDVAPIGDVGCVADYTRMSVDEHAVYLVFNMYSPGLSAQCPGNATGSTAFVIRKTSVLGAGPLVARAFR